MLSCPLIHCIGMALALPFSLPIITGVPATFAVCCLLVALVGLEYLVAVLQVRSSWAL